MTDEELKLIAATAEEATNKAFDTKSVKVTADFESLKDENEKNKALIEGLKKEVEEGKVTVTSLDGKLIKMAAGQQAISIKGLGGGQRELSFSKEKMYRGMTTGNWHGADMEKEIAYTVKSKAISSVSGESGGFPLPEEMAVGVIEMIRERNPLKDLGVLEVNPKCETLKFPKVTQGSSGYWVGQGTGIQESDMKFGLISMTPKTVASLLYVTKPMADIMDQSYVTVIENDIANALAATQFQGFLYGNGSDNTPIGLANIPGIDKTLATGADGDSPTKTFLRQLRAKVNQKYHNGNFKMLGNKSLFFEIASLVATAAPDAAAAMKDEILVDNACGVPFLSSGIALANKTKGSGTSLADLFYGNWNSFIMANWLGGITIERTDVGGKAFEANLTGIRATMNTDCAVRHTDEFAIAPFVKTI